MMAWNTRFVPTVNGPLHLGHLYLILVNYWEAKDSGGKFTVRFDDTQRSWNYLLGPEKVSECIEGMMADLIWLGIRPDVCEMQSEMMDKIDDLLENEFKYIPDRQWWSTDQGAEVVGLDHHVYPYTDRLTCEKVIMDSLEGISWMIRGMDLISEDCFYMHYCRLLLINPPRRTYVPRLNCGGVISKTLGKYQIREFRENGMSPKDLTVLLARDVLSDRERGWHVDNVRDKPEIGNWADEVLHGISARK